METVGAMLYLSIILLILGYIKFRIDRAMALSDYSILKAVIEHNHSLRINTEQSFNIVFLDTKSDLFSEIDAQITNANDRFIIVLRSPEWLFKLKSNIWKQHSVIDGKSFYLTTANEGLVHYKKSGKVFFYSKPLEFLDYQNAKTRFLSRLKISGKG
ncbi:hypothetical protein SAMN05661091_1512 [Paenibacillus uliginis N3/975]|uniref:Uncharacterized protein n=1 Tax=Paenibacillus uliginis N3/975 TaxID=1313296 RepID=A0A1X7H1M1_9BACL|nr:hypothetical protein [Paenibacillus uliginis]SMF78007.1 hypothetical protein SAMN05661091_1512 [Paenibacillus uliginis N3/975]